MSVDKLFCSTFFIYLNYIYLPCFIPGYLDFLTLVDKSIFRKSIIDLIIDDHFASQPQIRLNNAGPAYQFFLLALHAQESVLCVQVAVQCQSGKSLTGKQMLAEIE